MRQVAAAIAESWRVQAAGGAVSPANARKRAIRRPSGGCVDMRLAQNLTTPAPACVQSGARLRPENRNAPSKR